MSKQKNIYYCSNCKKILTSIDEVIFVEQIRYRCFCGEQCIIDFFSPMIRYYEKEEKEFRKEFKVEEKFDFAIKDREKMMELTLTNPDELWLSGKDLSEEVWFFFKKHADYEDVSMIAAALVFEGNPSFILLETVTKDEKILDFYRRGRKLDDALIHNTEKDLMNRQGAVPEQMGEVEVDPNLINFVEKKKSHFLAKLLEERKDSDIPFEEFPRFDKFLHETLEHPDEVYMMKLTEEEMPIPYFIYLKSFENNGEAFFYVVLCLHYQIDHESMEETLIPIISFPSKDSDLYMKYKKGERVEGHFVS